MAGLFFTAAPGLISTGVTKKTVVQLVAPANQRILVEEISISFEGQEPTDKPILVQVLEQSDAGTTGSALTPGKVHQGDDETIQSTAQQNITGTQPTDVVEHLGELVHPQEGFTWRAPYRGEIPVKGGRRLGIAVTAAVSVNCKPRIRAQE